MEEITMEEKGTYIYRTPFMKWITMEEKGAYILYPIHGVDQCGREGDIYMHFFHGEDQCGREGGIYTAPLPQGGSVWKGGGKSVEARDGG